MKVSLKLMLFVSVFLCAIKVAHAQIPLRSFGNIPDTSLMTISPNGKFIDK